MKILKNLLIILIVLVVFYGPIFSFPKKSKAQVPEGIVLTKSVDKIAAARGEILTYTINWQNVSSTVTYLGIRINDVLPSGVSYIEGSASAGGTFDGTQVYWIIASAPPSATGSVNFKVKINGPNPFGFAGLYTASDGSRASRLNATFARKELWWESVETAENTYNFIPLDDIYDGVRNFNLELMLNLRTQKDWGTDCTRDSSLTTTPRDTASCPPKDLSDTFGIKGYSSLYYDYVSAILEHLFSTNRPIQYLVVENEVNTITFWHGNADDFLRTRATVYKAVKDFNANSGKNIKVVDNGIADLVWGTAVTREKYCNDDINGAVFFAGRYLSRVSAEPVTSDYLAQNIHCPIQPADYLARDFSILKRVFENDPGLGEPSFDIMSYHFYAPWDTQEEVINWINQEMQRNGYSRPIMQTEGGFVDKLGYSNNQDVANDVVKNHIIAFFKGVKAWIWFPLEEKNSGVTVNSDYKGLYQDGGAELPAKTAYQLLVAKIGDFNSIDRIDFGNSEIYVYKVNIGGNYVYVLWANTPQNINLSGEIPGNVKVTQVDGTFSNVNSSDIPIGNNPIFVEVNPSL